MERRELGFFPAGEDGDPYYGASLAGFLWLLLRRGKKDLRFLKRGDSASKGGGGRRLALANRDREEHSTQRDRKEKKGILAVRKGGECRQTRKDGFRPSARKGSIQGALLGRGSTRGWGQKKEKDNITTQKKKNEAVAERLEEFSQLAMETSTGKSPGWAKVMEFAKGILFLGEGTISSREAYAAKAANRLREKRGGNFFGGPGRGAAKKTGSGGKDELCAPRALRAPS